MDAAREFANEEENRVNKAYYGAGVPASWDKFGSTDIRINQPARSPHATSTHQQGHDLKQTVATYTKKGTQSCIEQVREVKVDKGDCMLKVDANAYCLVIMVRWQAQRL